jgi:hypothetical protein
LDKRDRLRFIQPQVEHIGLYKKFVTESWNYGIQKEKSDPSFYYDFKLKGNPWYGDGIETVSAKYLLSDLFQFMYNNNYDLYGAIDLTKTLNSKSTLFFRSKEFDSKTPPRYINVISVSLIAHDKIRVTRANKLALILIRNSIKSGWPKGIQKESNFHSSKEFRLNGWPLESNPYTQVYITLTMMFILSALTTNGYRLITSMNMNGKNNSDKGISYKVELFTWFFEELYSAPS